jgi:hypothetical protein
MVRFVVVCLFLSLALTCFASNNTQVVVSSSQAAAYAAQSIVAMTAGASITDATLTGTVTWTAGSETETGTATFLASGTGESRMDLALSSGTRTEIRDASTGTPLGQWIAQDSTSGKFTLHNCQTDAVWFFPVLGSLAGGPNVAFSYIGQETRNGETVQHIQSSPSNQSAGSTQQQLSMMDFYLDATTLLPSAITFNAHADNNLLNNIFVEIDFSDYQVISGVRVPMHIQKSLQGSFLIDLQVSGAVFNSGIAPSNFSIN